MCDRVMYDDDVPGGRLCAGVIGSVAVGVSATGAVCHRAYMRISICTAYLVYAFATSYVLMLLNAAKLRAAYVNGMMMTTRACSNDYAIWSLWVYASCAGACAGCARHAGVGLCRVCYDQRCDDVAMVCVCVGWVYVVTMTMRRLIGMSMCDCVR